MIRYPEAYQKVTDKLDELSKESQYIETRELVERTELLKAGEDLSKYEKAKRVIESDKQLLINYFSASKSARGMGFTNFTREREEIQYVIRKYSPYDERIEFNGLVQLIKEKEAKIDELVKRAEEKKVELVESLKEVEELKQKNKELMEKYNSKLSILDGVSSTVLNRYFEENSEMIERLLSDQPIRRRRYN